MDRVRILATLDAGARALKRLGLAPLTGFVKRVIGSVLRQPLSVDVDGFHITGAIEHRGYLHLLRQGRREPFTSELFKGVLRQGMTVVDAGAYIGWYTLLSAKEVGAGGRVYAFEPDPLNRDYLTRNAEINGLADRVVLVSKALSDRSQQLPFFVNLGDRGRSSLYQQSPRTQIRTVDCVSLDDALPKNVSVDLIKMDIEGGEIRALRGMERTLSRAKSLVMCIECNPQALRLAGARVDVLIQELQSLGFRVSIIDEVAKVLRSVDLGLASSRTHNLWCVRQAEGDRDEVALPHSSEKRTPGRSGLR